MKTNVQIRVEVPSSFNVGEMVEVYRNTITYYGSVFRGLDSFIKYASFLFGSNSVVFLELVNHENF